MNFGLADHHWEFINTTLIQPLKDYGVRVWIFGSRAKGTQKKFSDLDVLYELGPHVLPKNMLSDIVEKLEESTLPIKIDIVEIANLAESYRSDVMKTRVSV